MLFWIKEKRVYEQGIQWLNDTLIPVLAVPLCGLFALCFYCTRRLVIKLTQTVMTWSTIKPFYILANSYIGRFFVNLNSIFRKEADQKQVYNFHWYYLICFLSLWRRSSTWFVCDYLTLFHQIERTNDRTFCDNVCQWLVECFLHK